MTKPWLAIIWFSLWGLFQAYAVLAILTQRWHKPASFPAEAYQALIYPDITVIPLYLWTALLLFFGHPWGYLLGLIAGGAVLYVMAYLLALSRLTGPTNLIADGLFLMINALAVVQLVTRLSAKIKE